MLNDYLRVFRAFTDENRVQILELLCDGEQCACVLLENLRISQPTLSHHMKILCKSGIVKSRRVGPWNYYSINEDGCKYASHLLSAVAQKKLHTMLKVTGAIHRAFRIFERRSAKQTRFADHCCCKSISKAKSLPADVFESC